MTRFGLAAGILVLLGSLGEINARACDFCMLGQGVSPYLTANGRGLTLDVNYTESDHLYDKATGIDSHGKSEAWLIYTLTGFYPVTDELTLLAALPYTVKTNIDFDSAGNTNPGSLSTGIGDATLTGRYTLFKEHSLESTWIGGLLAGLKFPTGGTDRYDLAHNPLDRHALPGTGSFDYHLGITTAYALASGFQLTGDAVFSLSGGGKWAGRDHRYGNTLNFSIKAYDRVLPAQPGERSLMPFVGVTGEWMGKEKGYQDDSGYQPDEINLSSGGTVLMGDVGIYAILSSSTLLNFSVSKAFYRYMNFNPAFDADPAENYRIDFSLTYLF